MWPAMFDIMSATLSAGLCALAVKLLDDYLDEEHDRASGRLNWAARLGPGTVIYTSLVLAMSVAINPRLSLSLFLASYAVGMFNDLGRILPTGLRGWHETLIAVGLGIAFFDLPAMLFALSFIIAVQLLDDCIDMRSDRLCGQRNFACRFGFGECLLIGAAALMAAWLIDETHFPPVFIGCVVVYAISLYWQGVKI